MCQASFLAIPTFYRMHACSPEELSLDAGGVIFQTSAKPSTSGKLISLPIAFFTFS